MPTRGFLTAEAADRQSLVEVLLLFMTQPWESSSFTSTTFFHQQVTEFSPQSRDRRPVLKGEVPRVSDVLFKITAIHKNPATYPLLSQYIEEEVEAQSSFVICRRNSFTLKWRKEFCLRQLIEKRRLTQEGILQKEAIGSLYQGRPNCAFRGAPV